MTVNVQCCKFKQHRQVKPRIVPKCKSRLKFEQCFEATKRAAFAMMGSQGRTVESCMSGEERARKDLEKDWSKYPSAERTQCAAPMANNRSPSYVELLICLEMMGDSRKHRDEEQAASKSKKSTSKP